LTQVDTIVAGKYRLQKKLGNGAFGSVFLAEQEVFGIPLRPVAIKLFETEIEDEIHAREIFNDAVVLIRLLDACNDPALKLKFVQIHDIGAFEEVINGEVRKKGYMAMELMERDLRAVVGEPGREDFKRLTVKEVLAYLTPVIDALAYMHAQKPAVLHRDLKPENVLFQYDGALRIKVADFGLAVQSFQAAEPVRAAGTISYQDLECHTRNTAAPESDVFALGLMFYELLTGRFPFALDHNRLNWYDPVGREMAVEQFRRAVTADIPPPSEFNLELKQDAWLEEIILRCLTPFRADRVKDAVSVKRLIESGGAATSGKGVKEKYRSCVEAGDAAFAKGAPYFAEAARAWKTATALMQQPCDAPVRLSRLYRKTGKTDKAEAILNGRIRENRECPHVYRELAELYADRQNPQMEKYYAERARSLAACRFGVTQ
jgi:serine/threonine-protein kinase